MSNFKLHAEKQKLDYFFKLVEKVEDEELKAHWARYLCILLSGYIENTIKAIISQYVKNKSHPYVSNYVDNQVKKITNLNCERLLQLLGTFSDDWRKYFEDTIKEEEKTAIDSVIANRNNIAHGHNVGLTYYRINDYYKKIIRVVDILNNECIKRN